MSKAPSNPQSPHWFSELLEDKFVKLVFKIILVILAVFLLFIVGKSMLGYHVKLFGIELNIPENKTDTAQISSRIDAPVKIDTSRQREKIVYVPIKSLPNIKEEKQKSKIDNTKGIDTGKIETKFNIQNPTFNAPTQVGDNNIQNNEFGLHPRVITEESFGILFEKYPNKNTLLNVSFTTTADAEMVNVKYQIIKILQNKGYKRVSLKSNFIGLGEVPANIYLREVNDSTVEIMVSPNTGEF